MPPENAKPSTRRRPTQPLKKFKFGILADKVTGPIPDFFEPMPEEELELWEGGTTEPAR